MKTLFSMLVLLFICGSNHKQIENQLIGTYKSPENNILNKLKYGVFVVDIDLELKNDSSYIYSTCSQITEGKWDYKNNYLTLKCENRKFIIDSLNSVEKYKKGSLCDEIELFKAKNNSLIREFKINNRTVKIILMR